MVYLRIFYKYLILIIISFKMFRDKESILKKKKFLEDIKKKNVSCVFVDAGANFGGGYMFFREFYDPKYFDYIFIDPIPQCINY